MTALEFSGAYPALANLRCSDCRQHVYSIPEAELQTYDEERDGKLVTLPVLRDGDDPPCSDCPKGGPENDELYRLSESNYEAWTLYQQLLATRGAMRLPKHLRDCPLFAENMQLIRSGLQAGKAKAYEEMQKKSPVDPSG